MPPFGQAQTKNDKDTMKITRLFLIPVLALSLLTSGCGNTTTLARVGAGFQQAAKGFKAEVASLKAAGLLTPEKLARLDKRADGIITTADTLKEYLDTLPGITAGNKAEIIGKIGEASSLIAGLLQNPDLAGLPPNNLAVQILTFASITLQNASIVIAGIQAPDVKANRTTIAGEATRGIQLDTVKVKAAKIPKGAEKYFQ